MSLITWSVWDSNVPEEQEVECGGSEQLLLYYNMHIVI